MSDYREHRRAKVKEHLDRLRSIVSTPQKRVYKSEIKHDTYKQWRVVNLRDIQTDTIIPGSIKPFVDWCADNCTSQYMFYSKTIYFESEDDASFFLMVWK